MNGAVAQLGERGLCKPEVVGSIPISSTTGYRGFLAARDAARCDVTSALRGRPASDRPVPENPAVFDNRMSF